MAESLYGAGTVQVYVQGGGSMLDHNAATMLTMFRCSDSTARAITSTGFTWGDNPGDSKNIVKGYDYAGIVSKYY